MLGWIFAGAIIIVLNGEYRVWRYNCTVRRHHRHMNKYVSEIIKMLDEDNPFVIESVARTIGTHLDIYSQEDINYILSKLYGTHPDAAREIWQMIEAMPGVPLVRGFGDKEI